MAEFEDTSRSVDELVPAVFHELCPNQVPTGACLIIESYNPDEDQLYTSFVRSTGMHIAHEYGLHMLRAEDLKRAWCTDDLDP